MNDRADFEAQLTTVFAAYADRAPVEVDAGAMTASVAHGRAHGRWSLPTSRGAWLVIGTVLAVLALGAALVVGSYLLRSRTMPGGGGLMVIAQLDLPDTHFADATAMHVFTLDTATGERLSIADRLLTPGGEYGPATWAKWSPDRTHVLLFDTHDGSPVGIVDVASRRLVELSRPTGLSFACCDNNAAWGPASDRIAALLRSDQASAAELVLLFDLSGGEVARLVLPQGSSSGGTSWSPDGSSILLDGSLPVVPTDGSAVQVLLKPAAYDSRAAWSPDRTTIAYATPDGVTTMVLTDGRQTTVTRGQHQGDPVWSPDGRRIAFVDYDVVSQGIYVVDVDGTHLTRLTDGPDQTPDWSPDGSALVFGRPAPVDNGNTYPSVWVVAADGGEPRLLVKVATSDW